VRLLRQGAELLVAVEAGDDVDVAGGLVVFCQHCKPVVSESRLQEGGDWDGDLTDEIVSANVVVVQLQHQRIGGDVVRNGKRE